MTCPAAAPVASGYLILVGDGVFLPAGGDGEDWAGCCCWECLSS